MDDHPLADWAIRYHRAGWHPLELPARAKSPPPDGRTGYDGVDMIDQEVALASWSGNIGLRAPVDVIGLDVDVYKGGAKTLNELLGRLGPLPLSWISHNGRNDGSGIRFYLVPAGMTWVPGLPGIEIIQRGHRYAVVFPSTHPEGRQYAWINQADAFSPAELPLVEELPNLPWPWIAELSRAQRDDLGARSQAADHEGVMAFLAAHDRADAPSYMASIVGHWTERRAAGYSRHDTMQHCLIWAMEHVRAGVLAGVPTLVQLERAWAEALADEPRRAELSSATRTTEFTAMLCHAVGKVEAKPEADILRLHDQAAGIPIRVSSNGAGPPDEPDDLPRPIDWREFASRDPSARRWLVEAFWPWGRSMALWADAKVGKSELALWCAAKLALGEHPWTGDPVEPIDVAYFDYEMTEDDLDDRLNAFDIDPARLSRLHYWQFPALHGLDDERGGQEVERLVTRYGAQAAIFDTFGRAVSGDENEADTVRAFYRYTGGRLKRLGVGYLRTDHAGKDRSKGQRGSSAKRDDVDVVWSQVRPRTGGALLDCSNSSRLGWVGPTLKLDRTEIDGVLRYSAAVRLGWPTGTADKAAELDRIGVPLDAGRPAAKAALRAAGLGPGNIAVLDAALKFRRLPKPGAPPRAAPSAISESSAGISSALRVEDLA